MCFSGFFMQTAVFLSVIYNLFILEDGEYRDFSHFYISVGVLFYGGSSDCNIASFIIKFHVKQSNLRYT